MIDGTHQWIAEAAAALSPAVPEEGADVEGQEDDPHRRPDHEVLEPELARVRDCQIFCEINISSADPNYWDFKIRFSFSDFLISYVGSVFRT